MFQVSLHDRVLQSVAALSHASVPGMRMPTWTASAVVGHPLPPSTTFTVFPGTDGDDNFHGAGGDDTFNMADGGNDIVKGKGGDDIFNFGAEFASGDRVLGGGGDDTLVLDGDYNVGILSITRTEMKKVETISLTGATSDYKINFTSDLSHGHLITVDASAASTLQFFDDFADGALAVVGSGGNDFIQVTANFKISLAGGAGTDTFHISGPQKITLDAGIGADTIVTHGGLTPDDRIDGGGDTDNLVFGSSSDISIVLQDDTIRNVEVMTITIQANYDITTADGTVAAGQTLTFNASAQGVGHTFAFDGTAEQDGHFVIIGTGTKDVIKGGQLGDTINGGDGGDDISGRGGADTLTGGLGHDVFIYVGATDSTGLAHDTLNSFDANEDKIDIDANVHNFDTSVTSGNLTIAQFDANMTTAMNGHLNLHRFVVFTPTTGDFNGHTFVVVDANGQAGYQADEDYVFDMTNAVNFGQFGVDNFI